MRQAAHAAHAAGSRRHMCCVVVKVPRQTVGPRDDHWNGICSVTHTALTPTRLTIHTGCLSVSTCVYSMYRPQATSLQRPVYEDVGGKDAKVTLPISQLLYSFLDFMFGV